MFWGLDYDFVLWTQNGPVARLEIESRGDSPTYLQMKDYEQSQLPVYIVKVLDVERGLQKISLFNDDYEIICNDWDEFWVWERELRQGAEREMGRGGDMGITPSLFDPLTIKPPSPKDCFEKAWKLLKCKSRRGLDKNTGETTTKIYEPFQKHLLFDTGILDYYLNACPDPRQALRLALDYIPTTTWERNLRGKLSAYETEEDELEQYRKS